MTIPILLVHGSFHNGECWDRLLPHLVQRGFEPHAVTLTGHRGSPRSAAEASMARYAQDVVDCAEQVGRPSLLLGHSMGGLVISGAAERRPELFSALIYLAGFSPPPGRHGCLDVAMISPQMIDVVMNRLTSPDEHTHAFPADDAKAVFYNRCTPADQAWAVARLSPQPTDAGRDAVDTTEARLGRLPRHYIECTLDAALPIEGQRAMRDKVPFQSVHTLESDHSPFVSQPAALAEAIAAIARQHQTT